MNISLNIIVMFGKKDYTYISSTQLDALERRKAIHKDLAR